MFDDSPLIFTLSLAHRIIWGISKIFTGKDYPAQKNWCWAGGFPVGRIQKKIILICIFLPLDSSPFLAWAGSLRSSFSGFSFLSSSFFFVSVSFSFSYKQTQADTGDHKEVSLGESTTLGLPIRTPGNCAMIRASQVIISDELNINGSANPNSVGWIMISKEIGWRKKKLLKRPRNGRRAWWKFRQCPEPPKSSRTT